MAGQAGAENAKQWSSKAVFLLAAIGSAVGLGNLWRFPYVAGENGGGAFVIFYVACVVLIGLPVLAAELFIGRRGRGSAVGSVVNLARAEGRSPAWSIQSWLGMTGAFIILTFYSVIAGWVIAYIVMFARDLVGAVGSNGLAGLGAAAFAGLPQEAVAAKLGALLADPGRMIFYHGLFLAMTVLIVARGIKGGIEVAVTVLMPAFFGMLLLLVIFALATGDAAHGLDFILGLRLEDRTSEDGRVLRGILHGLSDGSVISAALGQAFFSIGLGSALMMTYGAYMSKEQDIPRASCFIGLSDTGVGILAGVAIFPIVFHVGLDPTAGPTLMFQTLPLTFSLMPAGALFGFVFFLLALFAAITSSIALLEATTAWFDEQSKGDHRVTSAIVIGVVAFAIGIANALSQVPVGPNGEHATFFNTWRPADAIPLFRGMALLDFLSALTDIMLPVAGFVTAIFAGWIVSAAASREALGFKSEAWYRRWRFLIRYVCPTAIAAVIVYSTIVAPLLKR
ncbi:MAG: sodium-dependent transporter [Amphiplicatus sp.]